MNKLSMQFELLGMPLLHLCCLMLLFLGGCSSEEDAPEVDENIMTFSVTHPAQTQTRATATDFEASDKVGLFVTEQSEPLQVSGNYINNALLTYDGTAWKPAAPVYYDSGTYNVYAYYPFNTVVSSVDDYPFEVSPDQSIHSTSTAMGGYEASDFLWATRKDVAASSNPVELQFAHRMSRVVVRLIKSEEYEGDIPEDAEVFIHNTVTTGTVDIAAGMATTNPYAAARTIKARKEANQRYSAIVYPQRLVNSLPLIEVVMKGVSYMMESTFVFKPGIQHTVSLVITKNPDQIKIEIGGEVENWD